MCRKSQIGSDSVLKKTEPSKNLTSISGSFPTETACNSQFKLKVTKDNIKITMQTHISSQYKCTSIVNQPVDTQCNCYSLLTTVSKPGMHVVSLNIAVNYCTSVGTHECNTDASKMSDMAVSIRNLTRFIFHAYSAHY